MGVLGGWAFSYERGTPVIPTIPLQVGHAEHATLWRSQQLDGFLVSLQVYLFQLILYISKSKGQDD